MARLALRWSKFLLEHPQLCGRGTCAAFAPLSGFPERHDRDTPPSVPEVPKGAGEEFGEESSLPLPQRCKGLLAGNWRGQLTTVRQNSTVEDVSSLRASLVNFSILDGRPVVWLLEGSSQAADVAASTKASLMVGHTDPVALVSLFGTSGQTMPRVVLLGDLVPVPKSERAYLSRRATKALAHTSNIVANATPLLTQLLGSTDAIATQSSALTHCVDDSLAAPALQQYRLIPSQCVYMDIAGHRYSVDVKEVASALTDPLAPVAVALVDAINRSPERREALILFAAAHLRINAKDAYIYGVDRWGFDLLVLPEESASWKAFRFGFVRDVRGPDGFATLFRDMETELAKALQDGSAGSG